MISDKVLATRVALTGDHAAFTQLVERHQLPIRCYLRRLLVSDNARADDLAQETFLAAFQKMNTWKGDAKLSTWLHTIAYRKFLDDRRKHKHQYADTEVPEAGHDDRQTTDDEIMAQQLLALLKPKDRAFLTLAYSVGMSHAEIAKLVDQPLGSVKARIHRAKLKLNKWLEKHDHSIQTKTAKFTSNGVERHA